ncbi:hypothetical protein K503DRAFT_603119 [Rhizopogon vinicolor AM-OR11-026]|uniref:Uncharacterized protein n=1 Tax=Rhizopogon vinicolor AM-OR11-026 TaxID=1314800 RepID=A0A1B7MIS0_9AGAM|nr:hypothetical protein K503DRAFT_603119 [Rhizopogon vinicolor AM-OR11-026]
MPFSSTYVPCIVVFASFLRQLEEGTSRCILQSTYLHSRFVASFRLRSSCSLHLHSSIVSARRRQISIGLGNDRKSTLVSGSSHQIWDLKRPVPPPALPNRQLPPRWVMVTVCSWSLDVVAVVLRNLYSQWVYRLSSIGPKQNEKVGAVGVAVAPWRELLQVRNRRHTRHPSVPLALPRNALLDTLAWAWAWLFHASCYRRRI